MSTYTAEQIEAIGGRRWSKSDGTLRVYLNTDVWAPMVCLNIDYYKSGNIAAATLNGQHVSNRKAGQMAATTVYWQDGTIWMTTDAVLRDEILAAIADAVAALPSDEDSNDTSTPAAAVTALRQAGRTARDIARMVGVSVSTIYRWARGICQPRPTNAAALAALI